MNRIPEAKFTPVVPQVLRHFMKAGFRTMHLRIESLAVNNLVMTVGTLKFKRSEFDFCKRRSMGAL